MLRAGRVANMRVHPTNQRLALWALAVGLALSFVAAGAADTRQSKVEKLMAFEITSTSFAHQGGIPRKYTCEGTDVSPPLAWSAIPDGAKSLALIVDDPDAPDPAAPKLTWVHWVLYNIPPTTTGFPEAVASRNLPAGTLEGKNDWRRTGYGGPCPPIGRHRYFHKLYALDIVLPNLGEPTRADLEKAMEGHVLGRAELIGTYQKAGK
jgi:Raf kinase inhibitor-like YbhB/YbcL family protein